MSPLTDISCKISRYQNTVYKKFHLCWYQWTFFPPWLTLKCILCSRSVLGFTKDQWIIENGEEPNSDSRQFQVKLLLILSSSICLLESKFWPMLRASPTNRRNPIPSPYDGLHSMPSDKFGWTGKLHHWKCILFCEQLYSLHMTMNQELYSSGLVL